LSNETKENFNKKQDKITTKSNLRANSLLCDSHVHSNKFFVNYDLIFQLGITPESAPKFTEAVRTVQNNIQVPITKNINDKSTDEEVPTAKSVYNITTFDNNSLWKKIDNNTSLSILKFYSIYPTVKITDWQIYTGPKSLFKISSGQITFKINNFQFYSPKSSKWFNYWVYFSNADQKIYFWDENNNMRIDFEGSIYEYQGEGTPI
ncbi:hypothetical protein, partial [Spiroplasma sp. hyd1]|uniref:hypothetical protein n=1 Tax=Spiroplasma sp. hyd1 TaxID=1609976 RepID=UPI0018DCB7BC